MVSPSAASAPRKSTTQTKEGLRRSSSHRSKKKRDYGRGDSVVDFDDNYDDDLGGPVPLSRLVIPWTVMFVVSVIATLVVAYHQHRFNHSSTNQREHYYHQMSSGLFHDDDDNLVDRMELFEVDREEFLLSPSPLDEHYYPPTFFHDEFDDNESRGVLKRWLQINPQSVSSHTQQHVHKPVYDEEHPPLFPLSARDRLGFFLAIIGLMIAAGGGIGGGGLLVPIYILVMGFSPKHGTFEPRTGSYYIYIYISPSHAILTFYCLCGNLFFRILHLLRHLSLYSYSLVECHCSWWCSCEYGVEL